jgi:hypothetical protein
MVDRPQIAANSVVGPASRDKTGPDFAPRPVELPLFRFHLRQLFWFVAVVSTLLAALVSTHGIAAIALLLIVLVVSAHVFSTALGTRLRQQTDATCAWNDRNCTHGVDDGASPGRAASMAAMPLCRRSPWHRRGSTALPWLPRLIVCGVLVGGIAGAAALAATIGHRTSPAGLVVGGVSLAVLGGWFAFLGGSFYGIFRHGLRDALVEQRKDK